MKALVWDDDPSTGEEWSTSSTSPPSCVDEAEDWRHELVDVLSHLRRRHHREVPRRRGDHRRRPAPGPARRHHRQPGRAGPVRLGVQEQGRPAHARRRRRLPARARSTSRPTKGIDLKGIEELERPADDNEPFAALAFKIMSDPYVGKLTYFRVYSGKLEKGAAVLNSTKDRKERIGRILQMHANHREDKDAVFAGDIVAAVGLKKTTTGDTLCDPDAPDRPRAHDVPRAGDPRGRRAQDQGRPGQAVARPCIALSEEDPTFQVHTDEETDQTIIGGMGELHLEILVDRMLREFKVDANVGKPQVAYRETITQAGREGRGALHPPDRRPRPVRPRRHQPRAHRPRRRLRVRRQDHRRRHPQGVHPLGRRRHPGGAAVGRRSPATRWSTCGPP